MALSVLSVVNWRQAVLVVHLLPPSSRFMTPSERHPPACVMEPEDEPPQERLKPFHTVPAVAQCGDWDAARGRMRE